MLCVIVVRGHEAVKQASAGAVGLSRVVVPWLPGVTRCPNITVESVVDQTDMAFSFIMDFFYKW